MKTLKATRDLGMLASLVLLLSAPAWADSSYSFPNVVEGPATLIEPGGNRESVEPQIPILVGDRLWVPQGSRLEVVLSDRSLLRLEGESEIDFEAVAYSSDTSDRTTVLRVAEGHLQLVVPEDVLGDALPQIVTPKATIYVHEPGTFRVTVSRRGWVELVVRDGRAEIANDREASLVYPGDRVWVEGGHRSRFDFRLAGSRDALERWGDRLSEEAALADVPYVDRSLRYASAPLARHGVWVSIGGRHVWRPHVAVTWSPYSRGYWRHTPIGFTWVSYDPWGYVTHHYGLWDQVPGYGWVWYPGRVYSPAWVHWYWGPRYVGWCPSGYYASYYSRHHHGFSLSFGTYGWAAGSWHHYASWNFTAAIHFGSRHQHRHTHSGRHMAGLYRTAEPDKGYITTFRGVGRKSHGEMMTALRHEADRHKRSTGRDLPDVTDFVARKPLDDDLRQTLLKRRPSSPDADNGGVLVKRFPRSSSSETTPGRRTTVVRPGAKDPMPRVDSRTGREASPEERYRRPSSKSYRVEHDRDENRRTRVIPPRAERSEPRDPGVRTWEGDRRRPAVKPRADDSRSGERSKGTVRVSPRDVRRHEPPRATSPRSERRDPVRVAPRSPSPYKSPRATSPRSERRDPVRVAPRSPSPYKSPRATSPRSERRDPVRVAPRSPSPYKSPRATSPRSAPPRVSRPPSAPPRVSRPPSAPPRVSRPPSAPPRSGSRVSPSSPSRPRPPARTYDRGGSGGRKSSVGSRTPSSRPDRKASGSSSSAKRSRKKD